MGRWLGGGVGCGLGCLAQNQLSNAGIGVCLGPPAIGDLLHFFGGG